ncbi:heterokaryon incompatibility protein-domain-containing protein [Xylariales sp. PMI_506]|nr:heterokaryon incompatibility protein-domain-containing protein [Xylariales sp. PMI_506]
MRLINVESFQINEFNGRQIPPYAILSHTWEVDEVLFQDMQDLPKARHKHAFRKIEYLCRQAARDGWQWAWADTCCIDKTSSAELSEAINSMFKWYAYAMVCYVYLNDVKSLEDWSIKTFTPAYLPSTTRWFCRGWTLQELIAPPKVHFYTSNWELLGSKVTMHNLISKVTGIPNAILRSDAPLSSVPVAERLYWASQRETTRQEDMAYCLLGLFDVHMPLLYGEGSRAFQRLQEQIISATNDHTIFLSGDNKNVLRSRLRGLPADFGNVLARPSILAESPAEFPKACRFLPVSSRQYDSIQIFPATRGVRLTLPMRKLTPQELSKLRPSRTALTDLTNVYLAALNCIEAVDRSESSVFGTTSNAVMGSSENLQDRPRVAIFLTTSPNDSNERPTTFNRYLSYYQLVSIDVAETWDLIQCHIASPSQLTSFPRLNIKLYSNHVYSSVISDGHQDNFTLYPKVDNDTLPVLRGECTFRSDNMFVFNLHADVNESFIGIKYEFQKPLNDKNRLVYEEAIFITDDILLLIRVTREVDEYTFGIQVHSRIDAEDILKTVAHG